MKKHVIAVSLAVGLALALASCASGPKPETAAAAPAAAAPAKPVATVTPAASAEPAPADAVAITGFETEEAGDFRSWKGGSSSIDVFVDSDIVRSGEKSLKVVSSQSDYCGFAIQIPEGKTDWTAFGKLVIFVYGGGTGVGFNVYIEEGNGEQFVYHAKDDFAGWNQLSIPFAVFTSRTDWQASDAKVDRALQLDAVKSVQIDTASGQTTLYYDDLYIAK